jgi:hypothetical protein
MNEVDDGLDRTTPASIRHDDDEVEGEYMFSPPLHPTQVVISRAFFLFFPCNHSVNINIIIFFCRRSKRQRNFSLFYFASQES